MKHNLGDALFRLFELDFYENTPSFTWEMDVDTVLAYAYEVINLHPFALLKWHEPDIPIHHLIVNEQLDAFNFNYWDSSLGKVVQSVSKYFKTGTFGEGQDQTFLNSLNEINIYL